MATPYSIDDMKKMQFAGVYILEYMVKQNKTFPVFLDGNEADLESILEWLLVRDYLSIEREDHYTVTTRGREVLNKFAERYHEYLSLYDVFCAVDLGAGEFAFSSYDQFETKSEWNECLQDERWEDLRIAVAEHKQIDPIEIVFMNFINEGRFGRNEIGWQFDLLLGSVWDDILTICNQAIHVGDLAFSTDEGQISGENVINDIIDQGNVLLEKLNLTLPPKLDSVDGWSKLLDTDVDYSKYRDPNYESKLSKDDWSL